jgi:hypothetical protein
MFNPVIEKSDITTASFKGKPKTNIERGMNSMPPPIPTIEEIEPIITPKSKASIINSSPNGMLVLKKKND